jgi:hypothetical protein
MALFLEAILRQAQNDPFDYAQGRLGSFYEEVVEFVVLGS